jgi:phosphate transport system substrate-binding protein
MAEDSYDGRYIPAPGHRHAVARRARWLWLAVVLGLGIVLMACRAGATTPPEAVGPEGVDYSKLAGGVRVDGSSTVFPISEAVAEEISKLSKHIRVKVAFSGTGGGFEKFCRGDIDISDASRPIKDGERANCEAHGIDDILAFQIGIDALTVVVSPQNTWATCMTTPELNRAFRAGGAQKWSDIRPEWPGESIRFFYPSTDSGTFDYFKEAIIAGVDKSSTHRSDGTPSEDDNVLALGVEKDRNALGYFGFAYFAEAGKNLKAVAVNPGTGCVAPTYESALSGAYKPLSRPLFIYTRGSYLRDKLQVLGFVDYYLRKGQPLVREVGYISLPDDLLQKQQAQLQPFLSPQATEAPVGQAVGLARDVEPKGNAWP